MKHAIIPSIARVLPRAAGLAGLALCLSASPVPAAAAVAPAPLLTAQETAAPAQDRDADLSLFYRRLAPYGEWTEIEGQGWVWVPSDVPVDWRPYTNGHWVWSDEFGWTWVSDFDWGWAPFHYGRWSFLPEYGWAWSPGSVWAPAWVVWRSDADYIGWAPLPPAVGFGYGTELLFGDFDFDADVAPYAWCFCPTDEFLEPHVRDSIVLDARNGTLLHDTRISDEHLDLVKGHVFDHGIRPEVVAKRIGRPIEHVVINDADAPQASTVAGGALHIFRPRIAESAAEARATDFMRPTTPPTTAELQQRRADAFRAMDSLHESQRLDLQRLHSEEARRLTPGPALDALRSRNDGEMRSLDESYARRRHVLEQRFQRLGQRELGRTERDGAPRDREVAPDAHRFSGRSEHGMRMSPGMHGFGMEHARRMHRFDGRR